MIEHLSFSGISKYMACPRSWKFKYIEQQPEKKSSALAFGSAFHDAIESYVIRTNPEQTIKEKWDAAWAKQAEKNGFDDDETPEALYNDGLRMFSSPKVMYEINAIQAPQAIELPVRLTVPGVPVPVIGFIDIVTADGVIGDIKTSKSKWPEDKAKNSLQPLFYLAACQQMGIATPMNFRHYVFVKTKEPQVQVIETEYKPAQLLFLFSIIQNVWRGIDAGVFYESTDGWLCNENYCDFWKQCRGRFE